LTLNDSIEWTKDYVFHLWERSKSAVRYLSGVPEPLPPSQRPIESQEAAHKTATGSWWGVAGVFGQLRRNRERIVEQRDRKWKAFTVGEVHAELIQVGND